MKKFFPYLLIVLLLAFVVVSFTACAWLQSFTTTETTPASEDRIRAVYTAYAESGGTLSYDEWLESIKGEAGADGAGILSIEKTSSEGLVDTYTVTLTNGKKSTFTIKNGADGKDGVDGQNGEDGKDGVDGQDGISPTIGANGHWYIGEEDTGIVAIGQNGKDGVDGQAGKDGANGTNGKDGVTPTISINEEGYWVINGVATTVKARGEDGQNGKDGADGKDGLNGQDGKDGKDGADGKDGINGQDGKDGAAGQDGKDGVNGQDGKDGEDGNGILSIEKTSSDGLVDTYTITFTNGTTTTFTIKNGADGQNGQDGKDGIDGQNGADGQNGKDGADGKDGINGQDGKDGVDGQNGADGVDGKDGITPTIGANGHWYIGEEDTGVVAVGQNGKDGADGKDGQDGQDGKDGVNGQDGKDGVTPTISINEEGYWVINGEVTTVKARGEDGQNGKDGADGKDGVDGQNGADGKDGINGKDGKDGADGNGILSIEKTSTVGLVDTYTITFTNGTTTTFTIKNGADGADGSGALTNMFRYTLLEDGTYAVSSRYYDMPIRTVIPDSYEGKPVTMICDIDSRSIDEIVIPLSVTVIGSFNCPYLVALYYCGSPSDKQNIYIYEKDCHISVPWTYYSESAPITEGKYWHYDEDGRIVLWEEVIVPDEPTLSLSATGISWAEVENATHYMISYDGENWTQSAGTSVSFRNEAGSYTLRVRAMNGPVLGDIATATYQEAAVALSALSVLDRTVSWTATGKTVTLSVDNVQKTYTLNGTTYSYTLDGTLGEHSVSVTATGGYDAQNAIYYYGNTAVKNTNVTISALSAPTLTASASGVAWSAVANAASYLVKEDNGSWSTKTSRLVALSTTAGQHTVKVKAVPSEQSVYLESAEATYTYETKIVALSTLSVSNGAVSWTATADPAKMTIYRDDVSQGTAATCSDLTFSSGTYTYSGVPLSVGNYAIRVTAQTSFVASSNVYYYASQTVSASTTVNVSNLSTPSISTPSAGATTISWGSVSGANGYEYSTDGGSTWTSTTSKSVSFSTTEGTNKLRVRATSTDPTKLTSEATSDFTYYTTPITLSNVAFEGTRAKWVASARYVEVKEGSGGTYDTTTLNYYDLTDLSAGSKTVYLKAYGGYDSSTKIYYSGSTKSKDVTKTIALANTTLTFEEQTSNSVYSVANGGSGAANWTQEYWNAGTEGWVSTSNQMNSRAGDTGRVVNFSSSTTKGRFTYSTGSSLGLANAFSVRFGNYYTSYDIWYKIMLIDTAGNYHYLAGATNKSVMFPSTGTNNSNKVFTTVSYVGFDPIEVSAIKFEVYGSTGSSGTYCYFYVDDVTLTYVEPNLGSNASYTGGSFSVTNGNSMTKSFNAGAADAMSFTLKTTGSTACYADVSIYDGNYMVATGRYALAASATQSFCLIFNKWHITKLVVAANGGSVTISDISLDTSNAYAVTDHDEYRVAATSGNTSILLMGEEVKSTATINYNLTAIKQLQKYAADVTPLFASIVNVKQILSATYSQSINVMSNAGSSNAYGTLTIKYIVSGTNALTTSTITVKKKDSASLNEATRDAYSRNLWKEISVDPHEVILAGSSSMEKWERVGQDMKGITFADVGIGGTVSTDWTANSDGTAGLAERLIYPYNPRAVILFVGVNDLKGGSSVSTTLSNVQTLLTQIHNNLPKAKIYYVLINKVPLAISGSQQLNVANVNSFNNSMVSYANNYNWLTTIALDTDNHMVYGSSGSAYDFNYNSSTNAYDKTSYYGKTSFFDSMHLNQAGYTEWAYVIRQKFLALDKKSSWAKTD